MKKIIFSFSLTALIVAPLAMVFPPAVSADSIGPVTFESPAYAPGNINVQNGWSMTGPYDVAVGSSLGTPGFDSQSLRISNAVTSGSFGDQTFAPAVSTPAGETGASNGSYGSAVPLPHFESQFDIFAIRESTGDNLSVSPDQGAGARMSYLRFENPGGGLIHAYFDDVPGTTKPAVFVETELPTLDASVRHTIKLSMDFADGPSNDTVKIYFDGTLVHTGTSWENYYRFDPESNPGLNPDFVPTVRTMLFRASGTAVPGNSGKGYLIDNFSLESGPLPAAVTTDAATGVASSDATLNGTNGPTAGTGHSFWVSKSAFVTTSPTIPSGVYSTPDLGPIAANTAFSASLSSITTAGVPGNLPAITPNTTYYFAAWSLVGGTWYPGAVLNFTTPNGPAPATPGVTTNSATGITPSDATLNGTNGPVAADQESFWVSTSPIDTSSSNIPAGVYSTPVLPSVAANGTFSDPLSLVTTNGIVTGGVPGNMPAITPNTTYYYVAWVNANGTWYPGQVLSLITPALPASCPAGTSPVLLETNTVDSALSAATHSTNSLSSGQQYLITSSGTWQNSGLNAADTAFSSLNSWSTYMEGYDIAPYFLGPREFEMQVDNNFVNWGPYDATTHTYSFLYTGNGSPVALGVFDGDSNTGIANPGWYGDNSGNLTVNIYSCTATTGSISGMKYNDKNRDGKKGPGEPGLPGWTIRLEKPDGTVLQTAVTDANGNYSFTNLAAGTYKVREVHQKGWKRMSKNPKPIVLVPGAVVTDVNFGNAQKHKEEKEDTDKDDQRDDQQGNYHSNRGKNNYDSGDDHNSQDKR